jgi:hypothetical protein
MPGVEILLFALVVWITILSGMALGLSFTAFRTRWLLAVGVIPSFCYGAFYTIGILLAGRGLGIGFAAACLNLGLATACYIRLIRKNQNSGPNQSTDPTPTSGTPPAGQESRLS